MPKPWEDFPEVWKNEAQFCQWLRSQTRRIWNRHPAKIQLLKASAIPVTDELRSTLNISKLTKKVYRCAICGCLHPSKNVQVDHTDDVVGFNTVEGWHVWAERILLASASNLRILCKPCHEIVSYSQKMHCSFEEAVIMKQVVAFSKLSAEKQLATLRSMTKLVEHPDFKSAKTRRSFYEWLVKNGVQDGTTTV